MEGWAGKLTSLVHKARDKLLIEPVKSTLLESLPASVIPVFYSLSRDTKNVLLLQLPESNGSKSAPPTLTSLLSQFPSPLNSLDSNASSPPVVVYVAYNATHTGLTLYTPWPRRIWSTQPLPIVEDIPRNILRCLKLKLILVPRKDLVKWDLLDTVFERMIPSQMVCPPVHGIVGPQRAISPPMPPTEPPLESEGAMVSSLASDVAAERSETEMSLRDTATTDLLISNDDAEEDYSAERLSVQAAWRADSGDIVDEKLKLKLDEWSLTPDGQLKDIRVLLVTLTTVIPNGLAWESPTLGELMSDSTLLKGVYRRAILKVHPDKVPTENKRHKYTADRIFTALHKSYGRR